MNEGPKKSQLPTRVAPTQTQVSLEQSRSKINKLHTEIISAARRSLDNAIRIGKLLTEVKEKLPHGAWLPWLQKNISFSRQTADNYRRVFEQRDKLLKVSNLADAYRLLEEPPRHSSQVPPWAKLDYSEELVNDTIETVTLAASGMAHRGVEVALEECAQLFFLLIEKRLRITDDGQGEIFDGERWNVIDEGGAK